MNMPSNWDEALIQLIEVAKSGREKDPLYNDDYEREEVVSSDEARLAYEYFLYGWEHLIEKKMMKLELTAKRGLKMLYRKILDVKLSTLEKKFLKKVYYFPEDVYRELFKRVVEEERLRLEKTELERKIRLDPIKELKFGNRTLLRKYCEDLNLQDLSTKKFTLHALYRFASRFGLEISQEELMYIQDDIKYLRNDTEYMGLINDKNGKLDCYHGIYRDIEYFALCRLGESLIVTFYDTEYMANLSKQDTFIH